jgi:outer membrane receptor protein involved in Fe transport
MNAAFLPPRCTLPLSCCCLVLVGLLSWNPQNQAASFSAQAEVSARVGYDSNIHLQDVEPSAASRLEAQNAGLEVLDPNVGSLVTGIQPKLSASVSLCDEFNLTTAYSPDFNSYSEDSGENHITHRGNLNLKGRLQSLTWELPNTFIFIDGSRKGPVYGRPGDVPAIGGIPVRDRHEAFIFKNSFKLSYRTGKFLIRPTATAYLHDFRTEQRPSGAAYIYENYVDRSELAGGLDLGYTVHSSTDLILGYRFGSQEQYKLLGVDSPYDNCFHRILLGLEGNPWPWLKLGCLLGPDIRNFHDARLDNMAPAFDQDELLLFIDTTMTILPSSEDSITLFVRQYEQPAFGGPSVYEDTTFDISWRHIFTPKWNGRLGFRAYSGYWQSPVNREDWIFTPSTGITWKPQENISTDLTYAYDCVDSRIPNTDGREFTRHLITLGATYTFR